MKPKVKICTVNESCLTRRQEDKDGFMGNFPLDCFSGNISFCGLYFYKSCEKERARVSQANDYVGRSEKYIFIFRQSNSESRK
jgi:hypothetical protein